MNRVHVDCKCNECGKTFSKAKSEVTRNSKLNRRNYCSLSCASTYNNRVIPRKGNIEYLNASNRRDEFSGFREFIRRIKKRPKDFNITLEDLKAQWIKQNSICPYSGVELKLPSKEPVSHVYLASLDRIDSSIGYVVGNIQFVSACVNYMKSTLTHEETINLCSHISKKYISDFSED